MSITMNGAYMASLFQKQPDVLSATLKQIPGSVTTDFILFSYEVPSSSSADVHDVQGELVASGGKVTDTAGKVLDQVVKLGRTQGALQRVWLGLGSAGTPTYTNLKKILEHDGTLKKTLLDNFRALYDKVGATGFDLDYEGDTSELGTLLPDIVDAFHKKLSCQFTFCPYWNPKAWSSALADIYTKVGSQPVVGMNLQVYEGGAGNDPVAWTDALKKTSGTGVSDPDNFIWPIQSIYKDNPPSYSPSEMESNLKTWKSKGGSFWNNFFFTKSDLDWTMTDFSKGIAAGIA